MQSRFTSDDQLKISQLRYLIPSAFGDLLETLLDIPA